MAPWRHGPGIPGIFSGAGVTVLWAKALGSAMMHGFALLMGVTLLLPPATILRAIVQMEVEGIGLFCETGTISSNMVNYCPIYIYYIILYYIVLYCIVLYYIIV
jgi:hypothetical protein